MVAAIVASTGHASAQLVCGDPIEPVGVSASDALVVLRTAVGLEQCSVCACDTDGSGTIAATDSLVTLKAAVGQPVSLDCPLCCEHCACTPAEITLELSGIDHCSGCIPRVPASNAAPDSVTLVLAESVTGTHVLTQVDACTWQTTLIGAIAEKIGYGPGVTDCTGSPVFQGNDIDVVVRAVRIAGGWQVFAGQYAQAFGWGDMLTATIESASCDEGGSAPSGNAVCALKGVDEEEGYDTHATGGEVDLDPTDPNPVCH
jgi:hypothetical protein